MESMASGVDMSAMIWAALQADDARPTATPTLPMVNMTRHPRSDGYEEDGDEDDDEEDDDEMAPVMPQPRAGSTNAPALLPLPPSFYTTAAGVLPDVGVPSYLASSKTYAAPSSSELFLDDILHSQDDFHGSTTVDSGDGSTGSRLTPERLSQLEDNYERKKKRAKINRRDLNSRFQELMDLLHLKEDRKLNRAKVLEKAIEHIHKLTAELKTTRAAFSQQQPQQHQRSVNATSQFAGFPAQGSRQQPQQQLAMPQWPAAPGAVPSLNMAGNPMMWMPMMPSVAAQAPRIPLRSTGASARRQSAAKTSIVAVTATTQTQTSPVRPTTPEVPVTVRRPGLKRGRDSEATAPVSQFVRVAQTIPTLLELCDAWTLSRLAETSRDMRASSRRDVLWKNLVQRRWRLDEQSLHPQATFTQWQQLHRANNMPRCLALNGASMLLATGRCGSVGLWTSLVHRSNGRTTRTVLIGGRAIVRQVVELNVLIQNLHPFASLRLTDQLRVLSSTSPTSFRLITSDSRAHLQPHLVAVNDVARPAHDLQAVELFHGDFCVLSVFVECEGLDLEQQFLQHVDGVTMSCELWTQGRAVKMLDVHANALTNKHSLLAASYDGAMEKSV